MEIKKNKNLNPNKLRLSFFLVGINYMTGIVLAAFTYQNVIDTTIDKKTNTSQTKNIYEEVFIIDQPKEEIPPPLIEEPKPQQEIDLEQEIEVVDNKNEDTKETIIEVIEIIEEEEIIEVYEPIIDFPDVEASFMGGESEMQKWMQENLQYPEISIEMSEQGKVYLSFVVEKDGTITNVQVIKGISRDLDNEAKRLIRTMPKWNSGESKGLKVRSTFTMPISFELF